jgi:acetyl-CoA C-acetyltransferase
MAHVSVKSHANAVNNPKAHLRKAVSVDEVIAAPIVAYPLGLFDCCGVSDGSAAAIVCRADIAKKFRSDPIYIKSLQISASSGVEMLYDDDWTHVESTTHATAGAYKEAGIKNPRRELDLAEVHDCFTIAEICAIEDLGFVEKGKGGKAIDNKITTLDGSLPVNTSGGLKAKGHPVGATGVAQIVELTMQLRGDAGKRKKR